MKDSHKEALAAVDAANDELEKLQALSQVARCGASGGGEPIGSGESKGNRRHRPAEGFDADPR